MVINETNNQLKRYKVLPQFVLRKKKSAFTWTVVFPLHSYIKVRILSKLSAPSIMASTQKPSLLLTSRSSPRSSFLLPFTGHLWGAETQRSPICSDRIKQDNLTENFVRQIQKQKFQLKTRPSQSWLFEIKFLKKFIFHFFLHRVYFILLRHLKI